MNKLIIETDKEIKALDLAAESFARLFIQQITYINKNQINKKIEMKKYGKTN